MLDPTNQQVLQELPSWQRLHVRLKEIALARAQLDAEEASILCEVERIRLWTRLGFADVFEYLEHELGYSPRMAMERLRVARALVGLPRTSAALRAGALTYSAVREITRVATAGTELQWLEALRGKNLRSIEAMVSGRPVGALPTDPVEEGRRRVTLRFEIRAETAALVRQARQRMAAERDAAIDDDELLSAMARGVLDQQPVMRGTAAHQIAVTICEKCKRGWQDGAGVVAEMGPAAIEVAACDADTVGAAGSARAGQVSAVIPRATRRLVLRRDHGTCVVPTCRSARNLDLHHVVPRAAGGSHDVGNLVTLCAGHHRALHEGMLSIRGTAPDKLVIERAGENELAAATRSVHVRKALVDLGFSGMEAKQAVDAAITHVGKTSRTLEEWVREALRHCPRPGGPTAPSG